jgi:hypothetical protein
MPLRKLVLIPALCAAAVAAEPPSLDEGYRQMYNLEFDQAHATLHEYECMHPDDPLGPASDAAAYLFSEFDRLHILQAEFFTHDQHFVTDHKLTPDPALGRNFAAALDSAGRLAARSPADPNSMFTMILVNGLRSDYTGLIEKRYGTSLKEMKAGRQMAERLLAAHPAYYDAWVAVGVENYMLSIKALPLRWLLQLTGAETDRAVGLEKLRLAAEKGHYLAPFARLLLAVAALRDHEGSKARDLLAALTREFPRNRLYALELARLNTPEGLRGAASFWNSKP